MADVSRTEWFFRTVVSCLIAGAIGYGIAVVRQPDPPPPPTDLQRFIPPTGFGPSVIQFDQIIGGKCSPFGSVQDIERPQARYCRGSDGSKHDPCFVYTEGRATNIDLICFEEPWTQPETGLPPTSVGVVANGAVPAFQANSQRKGFWAWALELDYDIRCLRHVGQAAGWPEDAVYACRRREDPEGLLGWVVEFPNDKDSIWEVPFVLSGKTEKGTFPVRVVRAWW